MVPVIEVTTGVCGGKPRIAGQRIRVRDVVLWHDSMRMSPSAWEVYGPEGFKGRLDYI